jgi:hypothetical protein
MEESWVLEGYLVLREMVCQRGRGDLGGFKSEAALEEMIELPAPLVWLLHKKEGRERKVFATTMTSGGHKW